MIGFRVALFVGVAGLSVLAQAAAVSETVAHSPGAAEIAPLVPNDQDTSTPTPALPTEREDPADAISALTDLALIQLRTEEYAASKNLWYEILQRTQQIYGRWDARNIDPLAGLGASYQGMNRHTDALEHYGEAVHLQRVNHGLHDISQVPLLDRMTEIHAEQQSWEQANQLQEYAYYIHQRTHGTDSMALLPGLYRMAAWYEHLGAVYSARSLYEQAVSLVEQQAGDDSARLIEPLRKLAATYRKERHPTDSVPTRDSAPSFRVSSGNRPMTDRERHLQHAPLNPYGAGERALERAVELQQAHGDDAAGEVELMLELADWYLLFNRWNQAQATYLEARERWLNIPEQERDQAEEKPPALLNAPVPLVFPLPRPPRPSSGDAPLVRQEGHIELSYDVTERGQLRNLEITSSQPPDLMDIRVRRALRAARFRPSFDASEPVRANQLSYRHEFTYLAPLETSRDAAQAQTTAEAE